MTGKLVSQVGLRAFKSFAPFAFRSSLPYFNKPTNSAVNKLGYSQESDHSHPHSGTGHSHLHSHAHSHHENIFLLEKGGLKNPALRITWIGLLVNLGMAIGKGVGGVVFHSQALLADSIHALSDLVSDFLTLATVSLGSRPPSKSYPFGYGKFETLGSLGVSSILIMAGLSMGWSGMFAVLQEVAGDAEWLHSLQSLLGHGHSHSHTDGQANINAAWLALASIGIKEWLYFATIRVARKTKSNVLVANAWHHRIDSMVSMVAVATIAGGHFMGITWLDPLGGLIVSSIIVRAGWGTAKSSVLELADNVSGVPTEEVDKFRLTAEEILRDAASIDAQLAAFKIKDVEVIASGPNIWSNVTLSTGSSNASSASLQRLGKLLSTKILDQEPRHKRVNVIIDN
jgi:cation diffusion facilitator family transporter